MKNVYLNDSYLRDHDTKIAQVEGTNIVLEENIFYPNSGGQPNDTGEIIKSGKSYKVLNVKKIAGGVSIEVEGLGLQVRDEVTCRIDWERRYTFMRHHTASHILSAVMFKHNNAQITGNQISLDKTRFDFNTPTFDRDKFQDYVDEANELINKNVDVSTLNIPYDKAMEIENVIRLKDVLPPTLKEIRVVEIGEIDSQACGGTHIKNTSEIGKIEITKLENKGANNRRVYFVLK